VVDRARLTAVLDALVAYDAQRSSRDVWRRERAGGRHWKALVARFSAGVELVKPRLVGLTIKRCECFDSVSLSPSSSIFISILLFKVYANLLFSFLFFHGLPPLPISSSVISLNYYFILPANPVLSPSSLFRKTAKLPFVFLRRLCRLT
jgi:hypothetical protein